MHIKQWDNELRSIAGQLEQIAQATGPDIRSGLRAFEEKKYQLVGHDMVYNEALNQLKQMGKRKILGSHRLAALLRWVTTYGSKLDAYYKSQVRLLGKLLWLRLVHTRLSGSSEGGIATRDQDLVDMVMRRQNLQKTEKYLRGHLAKVRRQKAELHEQYKKLDTFAANTEAAKSMHAPLGHSYYEAAANPIIAGLESFIAKIIGLNSLPKETRRKINRTRRMVEKQSGQILTKCRNVAMQNLEGGSPRAGATTRNHYEQCISEIDLLEKLLQDSNELASNSVDFDQPVPLVKRSAQRYKKTL